MGECLFARRGPVHTTPLALKSVFADNTWAEIIQACQTNKVPETWEVGDQKPMTINGVEYLIDIIGKNHDVYTDGLSWAPLTFQLHNIYKTQYAMDTDTYNGDGWTGCTMRRTYLPRILVAMPTEVQAGLREVTKWTSEGNDSSIIETTSDKLFLLSEIEIFGEIDESFEGEGRQYAYYVGGDKTLKTPVGSEDPGYWLERSPHNGSLKWFCSVSMWGDAEVRAAETPSGVAFAFCF